LIVASVRRCHDVSAKRRTQFRQVCVARNAGRELQRLFPRPRQCWDIDLRGRKRNPQSGREGAAESFVLASDGPHLVIDVRNRGQLQIAARLQFVKQEQHRDGIRPTGNRGKDARALLPQVVACGEASNAWK
jgi:hypothetical protein